MPGFHRIARIATFTGGSPPTGITLDGTKTYRFDALQGTQRLLRERTTTIETPGIPGHGVVKLGVAAEPFTLVGTLYLPAFADWPTWFSAYEDLIGDSNGVAITQDGNSSWEPTGWPADVLGVEMGPVTEVGQTAGSLVVGPAAVAQYIFTLRYRPR